MQPPTQSGLPTIPRDLRWFLAPLAAISGCSGSIIITGAIGSTVTRGWNPASLEALLATDVRAGIAYSLAAFLCVAAATIAPSFRAVMAIGLYACGAAVAWTALRDWYFPELHPRAYQPSLVPLVLALLGGATGVIAVTAYERARRTRS